MTDHLPECPCNHADERGCFLICAETDRSVDCICPQLRACEQRVREEESRNVIGSVSLAAIGEANLQQYQLGFSEGLDAARKALVTAERRVHFDGETNRWIVEIHALSAIDALRGES